MFRGFMNMHTYDWVYWIVPVVLLIIIVWAIYMLLFNENNNGKRSNPAIEQLNQRYAKGEISDEEYQRMKKNITND